MNRMKFAAALVLVAACSGASTVTTTDQDAGAPDDASVVDGNVGAHLDGTTAPRDGSTWEVDAGEAPDASVVDGAAVDAGVDASFDGGPDASFDGGVDAGDQTDASFDAGPDASFDGSFTCKNGATRCQDYQHQTCNPVGGMPDTWVWDMGRQDCCHDPRFTVNGNNVDDSVTGLTWYRFATATGPGAANLGGANAGCGALGAYRVPTTAEILAILIGTPVNNKTVCGAPMDQSAFVGVLNEGGDYVTSDGCVDMLHGVSDPTCAARAADGWVCIAK